jgi:hypothetical protein
MQAWITSRKGVTSDAAEMAAEPRWEMWKGRLRPYRELREGDELWWYDSIPKVKALVWRSRVASVTSFPYSSVAEAAERLDPFFPGGIDRGDPYLVGKPPKGYALGFKLTDLERVFAPKPSTIPKFSQSGWEPGDRPEIAGWLRAARA